MSRDFSQVAVAPHVRCGRQGTLKKADNGGALAETAHGRSSGLRQWAVLKGRGGMPVRDPAC